MHKKIFIDLYRFDAKTDYLPYYQKHTLEYNDTQSISDLLATLSEKNSFGFKENMNIKINACFINSSMLVKDVVDRFSNEITIEPISEFRVMKDLLIDRSDFLEKLSLMDEFLTAEESVGYRKSTELIYYASNTLNYNRDYIGDHVLVIAADIITKDFTKKEKVLKKLTGKNGIYYHTSLKNRILDEGVEAKIQRLLYLCQLTQRPQSKLAKKVQSFIPSATQADYESHDEIATPKGVSGFNNFIIAGYDGVSEGSLEELISASNAKFVSLPRHDLASHSSKVDNAFSMKIAADILIQAKDENADFVVVKNENVRDLFDQNQSKMAKLSGRELNIPILTQNQFVKIAEGERDSQVLGLDSHKIKVPFL